MKRVLLCLLALILTLTACQTTPAPEPSPSSLPESITDVSSVPLPSAEERELPLSGNEEWTWNELYDYLENPRQSGDFSFGEGETVALLDVDGKTALSNQWNLKIKENMLVMKYNQMGDVIGKYRVVFNGTVSSAPAPSSPSSKPVVPSKPSENSTVSAPQNTKQLITLYLGSDAPIPEKAVEAFNKQSKTAELLLVKGAAPLTAEHLAQLKKQNNCPDLVVLSYREMMLAKKSKQLAAFSSFKLPPLEEAFFQKTTLNQKVYGLPIGGAVTALACNDELLYRAKATVPETWEELLDNAKVLRDTLIGVIPIGLTTDIADTSSMAEEFALLLNAQGGSLFTPDCQSTAFYSYAGTETLSVYETLQKESLIADYVVRKDFYNEKIGYGIVSSADYERTFGKKAKANFTAAPLVAPGNNDAVSSLDLYSFCLPAATSKAIRKEINKFLQFFYSTPEYSVDLCQRNGWVPALIQAQEDKAYKTDAWQVFIKAAQTARPAPTMECYPTLETYLAECVSSVLSGTNKETALEKAFNKAENRLARE